MDEKLKKYSDAWERADKALDVIKTKELQDPDYHVKNLPFLEEMLEYAVKNTPIEPASGMIEMQYYIKKMKQEYDQSV